MSRKQRSAEEHEAIECAFQAGKTPTQASRDLGIPVRTVENHYKEFRQSNEPASAPENQWRGVRQKLESSGDLSLESRTTRIKTLDQLLAETQVDLSRWRVAEFVVNKWEVGAKNKEGKIVVEPLFQVKARLRPVSVVEHGLTELIGRIEKLAPAHGSFPIWVPPRPAAPSRALELCVMDAHIGLLCDTPEADAAWDLDIAERHVLQAYQSLRATAKSFGPFKQVFMPIGNDFVHCDDVFHRTTAGTLQPEAISYHKTYARAQEILIKVVTSLLREGERIYIYQIPGNHSRVSDFTLARVLKAWFRNEPRVYVDDSSSPYKFHRFGVSLIGYEHGHSVNQIRLASLMANERPQDWAETRYREWHLGDQHRKGSAKPSALEEQGVSVEFIPGIVAPNEWHRLKGFNHQQRGAMAFVWDEITGPVARIQHNILGNGRGLVK